MIIASCAHKLKSVADIVHVTYGELSCDAVDGYHPAVITVVFCQPCADRYKAEGLLLETKEAEDAWLEQDEEK